MKSFGGLAVVVSLIGLAWLGYAVMLPEQRLGSDSGFVATGLVDPTDDSFATTPNGNTQALGEALASLGVRVTNLERRFDDAGLLQGQVDRLQVELEALRDELTRVSDAAAGEPVETEVVDPATEAQRTAQWEAERRQTLETVHTNERIDAAWSEKTTEALYQALLEDELKHSLIDRVECRATLCRLDVIHDNAEDLAEFELWLPAKVGEVLPKMAMEHREHPDGSVDTIVYLARQGYELPQIVK